MSRRTTDPAAHLLAEFDALHDRLSRSLASPAFSASAGWAGVARLSKLAKTIRDVRAVQERRARKASLAAAATRVTHRERHRCPGVHPESSFRGEVVWIGDNERSEACSGCGLHAYRD